MLPKRGALQEFKKMSLGSKARKKNKREKTHKSKWKKKKMTLRFLKLNQ